MTSGSTAGRQQYRGVRPRPARDWRGPLFGKHPELSSDYLERMRQLAAGSGTHLYFDTSFLMLLAKLGPPAREQFMAWSAAVRSMLPPE